MGKKKRNMGFTANQWRVAEKLGFTTELMQGIDKTYKLQGYPKSMEFAYGYIHLCENKIDKAIASFIIGAKNDGCVACMFLYAVLQKQRSNMHLALPFYFESAIRGNTISMHALVECYEEMSRLGLVPAGALINFWTKIMIELGYTLHLTAEERLVNKKKDQSMCAYCGKTGDYEDMTSKKWCGGCRYYSYCGKDCQRNAWSGGHMGECRQLNILTRYYRCKVKEIREAIIRGDDPKTIVRLQTLRTHLGLNRPKGEYEELFVTLCAKDKNDTTKNEYLTARNDGTVWIGSSPNMI
mmetsp:Transcript_5962/g.6809  ORF Transcript_5962/g.6809 Transcript_5962/m.6809 type:complete len:296 (+) Transcript_5962:338-1225(+)|eukprot:CAMPEP_0170866522 /NCGR_PEP_ID=MMETSP0734-20130129/22113_1 /TAXON_ID=186038 /ORGANISM="Fragilariopsis kerguelensis, Strain L26-C5" /LENGTH=295 /DNA_ID=CAMNT_0011243317 /DNA_START=92 /DNA_END=979 /DNA_ORIENTATION=+